MGAIKNDYGTSVDLTITLASLASDAGGLIGRSSAVVDNSGDKYPDFLLGGKVTTGTSPVNNTNIEILVWGTLADGPLYPDVITGSDAGLTISSIGTRLEIMPSAASLVCANVSNRTHWFGPKSIARLFGFTPQRWGVFVVHNTGVALHATGSNHRICYVPCFRNAAA